MTNGQARNHRKTRTLGKEDTTRQNLRDAAKAVSEGNVMPAIEKMKDLISVIFYFTTLVF